MNFVVKAAVAGVVFGLASCAEKPAPVTEQKKVEEKPAIAKISSYTVYFAFDDDQLNADSKRVINNIVSQADGRSVNVYGNTDTAGPEKYNMGLSERRAKNVASALREAGVKVVAVIGDGEYNLAVQTEDNVKNRLNRRAVVNYR